MITQTPIVTVIGESDAAGRYWILRTLRDGKYDVLARKYRRRDAAVRAAKRTGYKIQFWK